jgi:hypothetical protein
MSQLINVLLKILKLNFDALDPLLYFPLHECTTMTRLKKHYYLRHLKEKLGSKYKHCVVLNLHNLKDKMLIFS